LEFTQNGQPAMVFTNKKKSITLVAFTKKMGAQEPKGQTQNLCQFNSEVGQELGSPFSIKPLQEGRIRTVRASLRFARKAQQVVRV
jgi:hypothetical protein